MNGERTKFFSFPKIIFYLLSITAFYFAIRYVGKFHDVSTVIVQMNPFWLATALIFQVLTYATNSLILSVLLKEHDRIKFITLFKMSVVTIFVNQALPTGGLSGNGYVFNQLVKRKFTISKVYYSLITQTISYYLAIILMLSVFYGWYLNYAIHSNHFITYTVILGYFYFTVLGTLMILISNEHTLNFLKVKLSKFSIFREYLVKHNVTSIKSDQLGLLKHLFKNKKSTLTVVILQIFIILLDISTVYSLLHGFHINLSIAKISFALLLSQIIGALPLSPGSLIAYESAMTYFLTKLGIPVHGALIVTLMFRFLTFWLPMPIGMLFYRNFLKHKE